VIIIEKKKEKKKINKVLIVQLHVFVEKMKIEEIENSIKNIRTKKLKKGNYSQVQQLKLMESQKKMLKK
jgi:hypothetical protein